MNKFGDILRSTANTVLEFGKKNAPQILTGLSIAAGIGATAFSIKGTIKAVRLIDKKKAEEKKEKLTVGETVKTVWPCYIPTFVLTGVSVFSGLKSLDISQGREAAAIAALQMTKTAFKEYQDKTKETIGEKKESAIRDAIMEDKVKNNPPKESEILYTNRGNTLCLDAYTGRYFKSDKTKIEQAANEINRRLLIESSISLNEFYYLLGLPTCECGDDNGWRMDTYDKLLEIRFSSCLTPDGEPVLCMEYDLDPLYADLPWR